MSSGQPPLHGGHDDALLAATGEEKVEEKRARFGPPWARPGSIGPNLGPEG
jgi:hypothetical protein